MRSETRLESAVFQLTPTRTRCDLVIIANGEKEKMASGLLNPFLAHLKTARDQVERGGYSIVLAPSQESKHTACWFTKGTIERFVRFVSTPEVLERVNTIESEIVQIDEAIVIQGNTNLGLSTVDDHHAKPPENNEAYRYSNDAEAEKAIVLYKPGDQHTESNGSGTQRENSKVKLLRVLETRKTVLQKEQGMAFARAVAAGFDMDHMDDLISFSHCFGALRLREACLNFVDLWKRKHDTAQWLEAMEMQAAEEISGQSDLRVPWPVAHSDICLENSVKNQREASSPSDFEHILDSSRDKRSLPDKQMLLGQNNYFQGQFQHPMFMQWPGHSPQGAPVFPACPLAGMPYYPNYPGNAQFFQQPYGQAENPNFSPFDRTMHKRHSMDGKCGDIGSDYFSDQNLHSEIDREESCSHESRRKVGRASKRGSGMVVIRNINYITSQRKNAGKGESQSGSGSEAEEEVQEVASSFEKRMHNGSVRSSREVKHLQPDDEFGSAYERDVSKGTDIDNEHWKAFQNFLLSKDEDGADGDMFPLSGNTNVRRGGAGSGADTHLPDRSFCTSTNQRMTDHDIINSSVSMGSKKGPNDESTNGLPYRELRDHQDVQFSETGGGFGGVKRMSSDDFVMCGNHNLTSAIGSRSDPISGNEIWRSDFADKSSVHDPSDESFIVPVRSSSHTLTNSGTAIEMDSEFSSDIKTMEGTNKHRTGNVIGYEPDDLSMIPERGTERSYDIAVDYEMQVQADTSFSANGVTLAQKVKDKSKLVNGKDKKTVDKDTMSKVTRDSLEKRKVNPVRNKKMTKSSPLAEAQARAERLRAYKADLQKAKMEQEEQKLKRLEALKREREKRIAARSSSMQSALSSQQTKSRLSTKLSPSLLKSSKFTDSEGKIGARNSSLTRLSLLKTSKSGTLSGTCVARNGLTQSDPSLHKYKKASSGVSVPRMSIDANAAVTRLRRLSEPRNFNSHRSDRKTTLKQRPTDIQRSKISPVSKINRTTSAAASNQWISARSSPGPVRDKVKAKEIVSGASEGQASLSSSIGQKKINDDSLRLCQMTQTNDTVVIDKKVLTIEHGMPVVPLPPVQTSEKSKELRGRSLDGDAAEEKAEVVPEYAAIRVPPSNMVIDGIAMAGETKQVAADSVVEVTSNFSRVTLNEQPYGAPHARKPSLEDLWVVSSGYGKMLPTISETPIPVGSFKANVPGFSSSSPSKQILDGSERSPRKESKGLKHLLKFGRKNSGSPSSEKETDQQKVDGAVPDAAANADSGYEANSLKNLISQDDSYSEGSTVHKAPRSFSLLSPFRSKKQG